jgi:phosphohistidine phosphatase
VLTRKGKNEIKEVARWIKLKKFKFDSIATRPLKRAHETATIITSFLGQEDKLTIWNELAPAGDLDTVCYNAARYGKNATVLIVGHEPALYLLISKIICGKGNSFIVLAKGGLAKIRNFSLKRPSGDLQWLLTLKQIMDMR